MAIGIIPKHTLEIPLDDLNAGEFLVLALESAQKCGWNIFTVNENGFKAETGSSIISTGETIICQIHHTAASIISESNGKQFFNSKKNKKNTELFFNQFSKLKENFDKIETHHKYEAWSEKFSSETETLITNKANSRFDLFRIFIPVEGYFITPILINLNTLILILMIFSGANILWPDADFVLKWGGDLKSLTLNGQWWRMITANFLHFGIIHLFFNMNALMYIGAILEPLLGRWKFLLAYLLTGLTSSLGSLIWRDYGTSAGASGCVFGMYGVFFALLTTNLIEQENRIGTLKSIGFFIIFNLVVGSSIGADNGGHLGGLAGGLFIGYCYYFIFLKRESKFLNVLIIGIMSLILLGLTVYGYFNIPNPGGDYQKI